MNDSEYMKKRRVRWSTRSRALPRLLLFDCWERRGAVLAILPEYTNLKPAMVPTFFCWQCVFLCSFSLLQFGLVEGCDLRDVWFVSHVCRGSKQRQTKQLQEVMRT